MEENINMKKCIKCGKNLEENHTYCTYCGANQSIVVEKEEPKKEKKSIKSSWLFLIVFLCILSLPFLF